MKEPTVLIVPGLRDHAEQHWQTLLERELPRVASVPPMGRTDLDCARRVAAIERAAQSVEGPTLMMKGMTAQYLFRQVFPLRGGETILYHAAAAAAAGGVGLVACQWARALGVTMIGTVSTEEKAQAAKAAGCAHVIVTSREDIAQRVREITDGKGVPVVYDSVGKDTLMASLDLLQPRGTLVSIGTSSVPVVIDTTLLAVKGSIRLTRPAPRWSMSCRR